MADSLPLESSNKSRVRLGPRPGLKVLGILGLFIVAAVVTTCVERSFVMPNNLESLLRRTSLYAIIGIGVAFVILTGGIDLSIGSVMALVGCWRYVGKAEGKGT